MIPCVLHMADQGCYHLIKPDKRLQHCSHWAQTLVQCQHRRFTFQVGAESLHVGACATEHGARVPNGKATGFNESPCYSTAGACTGLVLKLRKPFPCTARRCTHRLQPCSARQIPKETILAYLCGPQDHWPETHDLAHGLRCVGT